MFKLIINLMFFVAGLFLAKSIIVAGISFAGLTGLFLALVISAPVFIGGNRLRRILTNA